MADSTPNPTAIADKVVSLVEDGLRPIERTIAAWPAEYRAIVWYAVADIATRRALGSADPVGGGREP